MIHFLLPASPASPSRPDEMYEEQAAALRRLGFGLSLFSFETLGSGPVRFNGVIPPDATVVYRGWMMSKEDYQTLVTAILQRGAKPLTSLESYLLCHHLPNWYPILAELTPETVVFSKDADLERELPKLGWKRFFLKDFVKSLKTSSGSVVSRPAEAKAVVSEMEMFRGTIEGGICVRRFESCRHESETRYFVIGGAPHAPNGEIPAIVRTVAERIASPFFSVDVAVREDGVLRVVEIGDGQVSDIVGWTADQFTGAWKEAAHFR